MGMCGRGVATHGHFLRAAKLPVYFLSTFTLTFVNLYEIQVQLDKWKVSKFLSF
jgi:hypothetical protein